MKRSGTHTICKKALAVLSILLSVILLFPAASFAEEQPLSIKVPFMSRPGDQLVSWEFPYSDDYFRGSSYMFNRELAKASMGLMVSAFHQTEVDPIEDQYETYLKAAGFQDIYRFGYDQESSKDTLAGIMGWKQIDNFILIAAAPRGQGYGKEWAGNLEVGNEERHVGFNRGAKIMEAEINGYIEEHNLKGAKKLWITGFSRASAVANLTAADMIDSGNFKDVYAYLYAVPRTTRNPDTYMYTGIYNICGKYDAVTQVPMEEWGYGRYGLDLYTPSPEMDSRYPDLWISANKVHQELMGRWFYYNSEINYQIHMILEFLCELFPTSEEYAQQFQDTLMAVWTEANEDTVGLVLTQAFSQMEKLDNEQEYSSDIMLDYISYIMAQHLRENQRQVLEGEWDPEQGVGANVFREHIPATYLSWVFSDLSDEKVFMGPEYSNRIYILGNTDVDVYKDGVWVRGIDQKGNYTFPEDLPPEALDLMANVPLMRNGTATVTCLPEDGSYQLVLKTDGLESLVVYNLFCTPYFTFGLGQRMYLLTLTEGEYVLTPDPEYDLEKDDPEEMVQFLPLEVRSGTVMQEIQSDFEYTPTLIMAAECSAQHHITLPELFILVSGSGLVLILILFVSLIIAIVHAFRKRKRGRPYSPWYVIVPHLLVAIILVLLTWYVTVNLYTVTMARAVMGGLTVLVLVLLALRGLIRRRSIRGLVVLVILLALMVVNYMFYQRSDLVSSSGMHTIIYSVCMAGLAALAISNFYGKDREKEQERNLEDVD